MTLPQIVAAVKQRWHLVAACVLLFAVAGLLLIVASAPVYRASIGFRVDPPEAARGDLASAAAQVQRVETVVEELHSRSVMESVVRGMGLQVEVTEPAVGRFDVLLSARTAWNAVGSFSLTRTGSRFAVHDRASGAALGYATPGTEAVLNSDVAITLAPTAIKYAELRLDLIPEGRRIDDLMQHTEVELPNQSAQVVRVHHEGHDAELARRLVEAVVTTYSSMRETMDVGSAASAPRLADERLAFLRRSADTLGVPRSVFEQRAAEARVAVWQSSIRRAIAGSGIVVVDHAHVGWRPVRPRKALILVLAIALGLVAGVGLALARAQLGGQAAAG